MSLAEDSPYRDVGVDFTGQEGDVTLLFHWFRIDEIEGVRLYPTFLRTALGALPDSPVHIIHIDRPDWSGAGNRCYLCLRTGRGVRQFP